MIALVVRNMQRINQGVITQTVHMELELRCLRLYHSVSGNGIGLLGYVACMLRFGFAGGVEDHKRLATHVTVVVTGDD